MERCELTLVTEGPAQTHTLATLLARRLCAGDVLALTGDLGAGKTVFTQGLARGLDIRVPVTSPTFTLINRYRTPTGDVLQHVDCYRLRDAPVEMWDIGLPDLLAGEDIVVIEWADRISGLLPDDHLAVAFTYLSEEGRQLCFRAHGARHAALLNEFASAAADSSHVARA